MSLRSSLIVVAAVAYVVAAVTVTLMSGPIPPFPWDPFWLNWVGFPVVGALILLKKPGNNIGRILLAVGVTVAISNGSVLAELLGAPRSDLYALASQLALMPIAVLIPSLVLLFPTGLIPTRWWRHGIRLAWGADALLIMWYIVRPHPNPGATEGVWHPNPLGVEALRSLEGAVVGSAGVVLAVFAAATVTHAVVSYRRGSAIERHQVRWVLFAAVVTPLLYLVGTFLESQVLWLGNALVASGLLLGANAVAVAIGVAVFKYRLFDIDRLISRTASYGFVVTLLAFGFFGISALVGSRTSERPLFVAAATLVAAALFNPLRTRMQRWVNRRFNRSTYDAEMVMSEFAGSLREGIDIEGVIDGWVGVVGETMEPGAIGVWVRD